MLYPLVMTNSSPWFLDGPRNRWFTELNSMVMASMANCECHNQMVGRYHHYKKPWHGSESEVG